MKLLLIDHEDSFVHNVRQALAAGGAQVRCLRATVPLEEAVAYDPDAVVLSPGPGHPRDRRLTGLARSLLGRWDRERPFLGVFLVDQMIGQHYGARVVLAPTPVHGEVSELRHDGRGIFRGVPSPMVAARYHSLVIDPRSVPSSLEVTARGTDGLVMALRHRSRPIESVQFHPESYLTRYGPSILRNFVDEAHR